jgi:hypothetical protein
VWGGICGAEWPGALDPTFGVAPAVFRLVPRVGAGLGVDPPNPILPLPVLPNPELSLPVLPNPELPLPILPDDDDVVPDAEGAALADAATVRAVAPMAAIPNMKAAAVLAMRVLIMLSSFFRSLVGWSKKRIKRGPQWNLNAWPVCRHAATRSWCPATYDCRCSPNARAKVPAPMGVNSGRPATQADWRAGGLIDVSAARGRSPSLTAELTSVAIEAERIPVVPFVGEPVDSRSGSSVGRRFAEPEIAVAGVAANRRQPGVYPVLPPIGVNRVFVLSMVIFSIPVLTGVSGEPTLEVGPSVFWLVPSRAPGVRDDPVRGVDPGVCGFEGAPGAALAGAATATTVPPRAASPNVNRAAVLAMRVLIMLSSFFRSLVGWSKKRIKRGPQWNLNAWSVCRHAATRSWCPAT